MVCFLELLASLELLESEHNERTKNRYMNEITVNKCLRRDDLSKNWNLKWVTFLFSGRALNFGILTIISSSSSAELFILTERTRWDVSNSGSLGRVNLSLTLFCIVSAASAWHGKLWIHMYKKEKWKRINQGKEEDLLEKVNYSFEIETSPSCLTETSSSFLPLKHKVLLIP